jgi:2-dehydro-3-deoxygluconokinase
MGTEEVVIKDGASRCLISHEDINLSVTPPELLEPIDTTGAGDAFAAGYLGARLLGRSPEKAADLAHRIAGQVIMKPGGVISKSDWQAVSEE